ncbi:hypothetical protein ACFC0S_18775 [Streptomyces sp. NPDC056084]|uniref:hypothetical protein n=1 Tax=unclassified Streptomyces TaxID=2593676 RepID=UPI0035D6871F
MPSHDRTAAIPRPEPTTADLAAFTSYRDLPGLVRQLSSLGGCAQPIRLEGHRTEINTTRSSASAAAACSPRSPASRTPRSPSTSDAD